VSVGADHAGNHVPDGHAVAHLGDRGLVVLAENLQRAVLKPRRLRQQFRCGRNGFLRHMFSARRIAIRAPHRHGTLARLFEPAVGVKSRCSRQLAGALLIGVGSTHGGFPSLGRNEYCEHP
jgi:hypothetical protein